MTPVSQDLIKKLHDHYAHAAISIFNDEKEVVPQCFLIGVDGDGNVTDTEATPAKQMQMFFGSERGKDIFALFPKEMLDDTHEVHQITKKLLGFAPTVIVQVNEAWMRYAKKDALYDGVAPSQHPDRKEVILISIHTRTGSIIGMHKIEAQPKRHAVFQELRMDQYTLGGRFTMQDAFGSTDNPVH